MDFLNVIRKRYSEIYGYSASNYNAEIERWKGLVDGVSRENRAVQDAIDNIFLRSYPSVLPKPALLLEEERARWWIDSNVPFVAPYPPRYAVNAILEKINQNGPHLTVTVLGGLSMFTVTASPAELDGKPDREWIIFLDTPAADRRYTGMQLWQAVDELPDETYQAIGEPVINEPFFYGQTFAVQDLTGDGRSDLITTGEVSGFGMLRTNFTIYQWTGTAFKKMSNFSEWIDMEALEDSSSPRYQVMEGNGPPALRIVEDINRPWGCVYQKILLYRWPNGSEERQETNTGNPNSLGCLLARAGRENDIVAAIPAYQHVLANHSSRDSQALPMISFAHYQLALLYAAQGNDAAARQHLIDLRDDFQEKPKSVLYLRSKIAPLLEKPVVPLLGLCNLGYNADHDAVEDWYIGLNYPSYLAHPFPEDICMPVSFAIRLLETAPLEDETALRTYLETGGARVPFLHSFQISDSKELAWLVQIDDVGHASTLFAYLRGEDGWKWKPFASLPTNTLPMVLSKDTTADGANEIVVASPYENADFCETGQQAFRVHLAGRFDRRLPHYLEIETKHCQSTEEPLQLEAFLIDQDGDGVVDRLAQAAEEERYRGGALEHPAWPVDQTVWYSAYDLRKEYRSVGEQEDALFTALFNGSAPAETREKLLRLRDTMLPEIPGYHARQQIDYLIALSYEMEGNTAEAVRGYLALAQQKPQTLWTSLAALRLKEK